MSDAGTSADRLQLAAQKLEDAQVLLDEAEESAPHEDFENIIKKADGTLDDMEGVLRDLMVHAELWEKSDELDDEGVIDITEEDDGGR
jgi:hypothetical protein